LGRPAFATWLSRQPGPPLIVVLNPGELDGAMDGWRAAGLPAASIPMLDPTADHIPHGSRVLDVRQRGEWVSGHLPRARHARLRAWRAQGLGVYRYWRDLGHAVGAVIAGLVAGAFGLSATVLAGAALTLLSGLLAARWITGNRGRR
jgi:rhodanese-related sulfurtransferase